LVVLVDVSKLKNEGLCLFSFDTRKTKRKGIKDKQWSTKHFMENYRLNLCAPEG
jgi:hypothetical protein